MTRSGIGFTVLIAALAAGAVAQDAAEGKRIFQKCASCHQVGEGAKNRVGPVLTGVVGRVAGSYEGYKYGASMKAAGDAGLVWTAEKLAEYLVGSTGFLRDELDDPNARGKMSFRLKKEEERRDVIAYVATFSAVVESETESAVPAGDAVETAVNAVCVRNRNSHDHLFAVEAEGAERRVQMLKPGEILCTRTSEAVETGTVSVFENAGELEGCSRLVPVGQTEDLLKYVDFDRCFWRSNT